MLQKEEYVILVDHNDNEVGTMEKMEVHQKGLLHRAFSVFVFNANNELMVHKRALGKYHSPGLWTNTCCSHPRPGESTEAAAHRRLQEEMGFDCPLEEALSFIYNKNLDNDLTEHEFDHVFVGQYDGKPVINTDEVYEWKFQTLGSLRSEMDQTPENFTEWFKICFDRVEAYLNR
jgi:isopentenyl-diphosphate delta-isomerase